jgi:two-component system sensor histidine kinase KdpD
MLAESERLHRTLLDNISHELKTPLAVLHAAAEELLKEKQERRETLTEEIRTASFRLERLVANLLSQSRLESGMLKPNMDWCDARDLIAAARRNAGDLLKGRVVKVEIPADIPLFRADVVLTEQALANLLVNAAVHTPAALPIYVRCSTRPPGGGIFIEVEDKGPGIPPEMMENLFAKFQRGKQAKPGGMGLGLSIVRGFMRAQGGDATAENNPQGGAKLTISLPPAEHELVPTE